MPKLRVATGIEIYYEEHGAGAPLLLIPGLTWAHWCWEPLIAGLQGRYRLIAVDNRGAGDSDVPPGPYSIAGMAAEAAEVLDRVGVAHAHVLGTSMGGFIAQELALNHPEQVDRLLLLCTSLGGPEHVNPPAEALMLLQPDPALSPEASARRLLPILGAPGYWAANPAEAEGLVQLMAANRATMAGSVAQIGAILAWPGTARRLPELDKPTLVIHGDGDQLIPVANAHKLAALLPHARLEIIAGAGHVFPVPSTPTLLRLITDFLG